MVKCDAAKCLVNDSHGDLIVCNGSCSGSFHSMCVGLSRSGARALNECNSIIFFVCPACVRPNMALDEFSDNHILLKTLLAEVGHIKLSINSLNSKSTANHNILSQNTDDLGNLVEGITSKIDSQSARIGALETRFEQLICGFNNLESSFKVIDDVKSNVDKLEKMVGNSTNKINSFSDQLISIDSQFSTYNIDTTRSFKDISGSVDSLISLISAFDTRSTEQMGDALAELRSLQFFSKEILLELPKIGCVLETVSSPLSDVGSSPSISLAEEIENSTSSVIVDSICDNVTAPNKILPGPSTEFSSEVVNLVSDSVDVIPNSSIKSSVTKKNNNKRNKRKNKVSSGTDHVVDLRSGSDCPVLDLSVNRACFPTSAVSAPLGGAYMVAPSSHSLRPLVAVLKPKTIFVTELVPHTSAEDVLAHLSQNCHIDVKKNKITCKKIASNRCSSFKLIVPDNMFARLLSPAEWPANVFVKEFIPRRELPVGEILSVSKNLTPSRYFTKT